MTLLKAAKFKQKIKGGKINFKISNVGTQRIIGKNMERMFQHLRWCGAYGHRHLLLYHLPILSSRPPCQTNPLPSTTFLPLFFSLSLSVTVPQVTVSDDLLIFIVIHFTVICCSCLVDYLTLLLLFKNKQHVFYSVLK